MSNFIANEIVTRRVDELIPYARNSRTHSDAQVATLAGMIREYGFTQPLLIDGEDGIKAGHGRLLAARKLGMEEVPCIVIDHLSPAQLRALVIADNRAAELAGWDEDILNIELGDLQALDFDLGVIGFDDWELDLDLGEEEDGPELNGDPDEVPEPPSEPVTKTGDVWVLGRHRVMCGDSTDAGAVVLLMDGARADFCFTSPPYNSAMTCDQMHSKAPKACAGGLYVGGYSDNRTSEEYVQFNADIIATLSTVAAENFTCCYNINYNKNSPSEYIDVIHAAKKSLPLVETIVWEKAMAVSLQGDNLTRIYEFVFVLCKGKLKINKEQTECVKNLWKISNIGANHESHKACFPVALVEEGIKNFCPPSGNVIEPFGGTGTTVIAAEKLGCQSFAMELDPKYCDVIVTRWQTLTGKTAIHAETGEPFGS